MERGARGALRVTLELSRFARGGEIQNYFEKVSAEYGVTDQVRFNESLDESHYRDGQWHLTTSKGNHLVVDFVVAATGILHHPAYPDIKGMDSFQGAMFHTARWDHEVSLEGKRVGIIGTGSTASQVISEVSKTASELTVFQRTPQWIFSVSDKNYTEAEIWWGGVNEVYSKFVRVMRELMDAGAKDDDLRVVLDSMYDVVSVARESRSDLAVVSTITRINFNMQQQMASEGIVLTDACRTACALLSKSVVDSRMQSQNTAAVVAKLEHELPPKDLRIIVDLYDAYMAELMKIGMCRFEMIVKYERTKLTKDMDVLYGIPISEVTKEEGPYAEDGKKIVESLQKEMIMYKNGIRDLLQKLPVRSAAQLYLSAYPSAPDPITLAFELKKKLEPKSREVWADEKDNMNAASP